MALVTPDLGERIVLDKMLSGAGENYVLKLYRNNLTPTNSSVLADFTETTFTGYSSQTMTAGNWSAATTNPSNKAESSNSELAWTCGSTGDTIYGYFVENAAGSVCLWAEKFDTARPLSLNDVFKITPKFTLNSET